MVRNNVTYSSLKIEILNSSFFLLETKTSPTVVARADFDAGRECDKLLAAIKTFWSTDTTAIATCLTGCSYKQRQELVSHFTTKTGTNLVDALDKVLGGNHERLMFALLRDPILFLSIELHDALSERTTDERVLVEILCTKDSAEITQLKETYKRGALKLQASRKKIA